MFVGFRPPSDSAYMNAGFMGKGAVSDKRLPFEMPDVGYLIHEPRHIAQFIQPVICNTGISEFYLEVWDNRAKIGIPAPFANAVDSSLHLHCPVFNRNNGVCNCAVGIIVSMNTKGRLNFFPYRLHNMPD